MLPAHQRSKTLTSRFSKFKHHLPSKSHRPPSSLPSLLSLCDKPHLLRQVHSRFVIHGLHQNPALCSDLIGCYAQLSCLDLSIALFDSIDSPGALLHATLIRHLSSHGDYSPKTILTYRQMLSKSLAPDQSVYPFVLKACSNCSTIETGAQVHCHVVRFGFESNLLVGNALVELYGRHGDVVDARKLFEVMPVRNLVSWNLIMSLVREYGDGREGFRLFQRMRSEGFSPHSVAVVSLLRLCVDLDCLRLGKSVHLLVIVNNLGGDLSVSTALLTMYCRFGCLEVARLLFDKMENKDTAVWNVMISAYSRNRHPLKALELLAELGKRGLRTDLYTAIASLSSVAELRSLIHGKQIHGHVIRNGSDYQVSVHNSLIDMYAQCKSLQMAKNVFDSLAYKSTVSWSAMIKGYLSNGYPSDALQLFNEMKTNGSKGDPIVLISVFQACVSLGALEQLKNIHGLSVKEGLNKLDSIGTSLLDSYAKCGCIDMAQKLFDEDMISHRDTVSWNSMIGAYSKLGDWDQCYKLYKQMKDLGSKPDRVTFLGLLTACVNSGLVKEGWECFNQMVNIYGLQPDQEHYASMVDLLGRSGELDEAVKLIEKMPFKPDVRVWGPLLSACKLHSETGLAEYAAGKLIEMEPKNAGNYVLLSNIYAAAGRWDGVAKMRGFLRQRGLKKTAGCSWLEINGCVHEFRVMDRSHPNSHDIYAMLRTMEFEAKADDNLMIY